MSFLTSIAKGPEMSVFFAGVPPTHTHVDWDYALRGKGTTLSGNLSGAARISDNRSPNRRQASRFSFA